MMFKKWAIIFMIALISLGNLPTVYAEKIDVQTDARSIISEIKRHDADSVIHYKQCEYELQSYIDMQKKLYEDISKNGDYYLQKSQQENKVMDIKRRFSLSENKQYATRSSSILGTYGDILVSYSASSSSFNIGAPGHAAIVSNRYADKTIESWPKSNSPIGRDGVQYYSNNWKSKAKVYAMSVKRASIQNYRDAATIAEKKIGKPYPAIWQIPIMSKYDDSKYYCSQLVWRAWKDQGFDIDYVKWDHIVSPMEIVKSDAVSIWYHKN